MARRFLAARLLRDAIGKIYYPVALFSRRVVQRSLSFLRKHVLTPLQTDRLVSRLNSASRHVIPTEWEVIVVAASAKHGSLRYEPAMGKACPDIWLENAGNDRDIAFVAEAVAVSDYGTMEKNPSDFLFDQLFMMAMKLGLNWSSLGWHVGDRMEGRYPNRWIKVLLPGKSVIQSRLKSSIKPFLLRVRNEPSRPHELIWNEPDVDFRLIHDPTQRQARFGGPLIATVPYSKTQNPLYERLRSKAKQLAKTGFSGIKGVIVGDADCYCLQKRSGDGSSYGVREIVRAFLSRYPSVTFVTTSRYEHQTSYMMEQGHFLRHNVYFRDGLSDSGRNKLLYLLDDLFGDVPRPIQSPSNALRDVVARRELSRGSRIGAYEWQGTQKLKIPTRVFLGLVGRTLTRREFKLLFYRPMPPNGGPLIWFFRKLVTARIPVRQVWVELLPDEDDDWIVFETRTTANTEAKRHGDQSARSCDLRLRALARYIAGLDYMMQCKQAHQSAFGALPEAQCGFVRSMLAEGRLLVSAQLEEEGKVLRLFFGDIDAAISPYR